MSVKYLLPCRCGQQLVVESRQAGETIACSCGASPQAPTLLGMADLETVPEAAPSADAKWGGHQGMLLLGIVFLVAAMGIVAIAYFGVRPIPPADLITPERIRETAKRFTPTQTWAVWENLKQGLDRRIDKQYSQRLALYYGLLTCGAVPALIGIGLIVAGVSNSRRGGNR